MSLAFIERSIQLINGKIRSVYNQMSSAISIVAGSVSSIEGRVTTLEGVNVPEVAIAKASLTFSAVHTQDEASIWTDGDAGKVVRLQGDNVGFSTLALPTATGGTYYVLTNVSSTSNHTITINASGVAKYVLQPLETATLVYTVDGWIGLMGFIPSIAITLT